MTNYIVLAAISLGTCLLIYRQRNPRRPALAPALAEVERRRREFHKLLPSPRRHPHDWTEEDLPLLQHILNKHMVIERHNEISFDEHGEMNITPVFTVASYCLAYALGEALGDIFIHELPSFRWKAAAEETGLPFDARQNPVFLAHESLSIQIPMYGVVARAIHGDQPLALGEMLGAAIQQVRPLLDGDLLAGH